MGFVSQKDSRTLKTLIVGIYIIHIVDHIYNIVIHCFIGCGIGGREGLYS